MSEALMEDLRREISKGQCIAIVGAGVSIYSTGNAPCASWIGLLRHGLQRCTDLITDLPDGWAERETDAINSGDIDDLLAVAGKVSSKLGAPHGGEYARWLKESVGALEITCSTVLEALKDLGVIIATTNYDDLIERVTGLPAITWKESARIESALRGDTRAVLHLHGHWQRPESVILGIRSYEHLLSSEHAQAMLRAMASMRTILFVGCGDGLHDPNFGALLQWTGRVLVGSEYRRFRLARTSELGTLQKQHPPEQRLFVLAYGSDFSDLAPYLCGLRSSVGMLPQAVSSVSPSVITLPPRPLCFGREVEIADLVVALFSPQPKLLPILGPPGIGKTNLALTVVHHERVAAQYGSRRWFVRCDGVRTRADLAGAIAVRLGLVPGTDNESVALRELSRAPSLLILDNAETPWESDTLEVEDFLGRLAGISCLALLITLRGSQRPAGISWHKAAQPQPISPSAARELFLSIAGLQFAADPCLDKLLSALDHVPLAITLIAALAEGEPNLDYLWQRWQNERTAMLQRAGGRDRITNIELSYELSWAGPRMTSEARRLLTLLALLPAGLAHTDLAAVLPQADNAASVVRKAGLAYDEANRLRVLAPLREYVQRRYQPTSDDLQRTIAHFIALAVEHGQHLGGKQGGASCKRLILEAQNIEKMLLRGLLEGAADAVISAASSWSEFVRFSGVGSIAPLEGAAVAAKNANNIVGLANCINGLGNIALARSEHGGATARYEEALSLYRQLDNPMGEATCIRSLGDIALRRSDYDGARTRYDEALAIYRDLDNLLGEANCIRSLGDIALRRSDHDDARVSYMKALSLYKTVGNLLGEAACIRSLGDISLAHSDHDGAKNCYDQSLPLYRQMGNLLGEANCIRGLGDIALQHSDCDGALARYDEALPLYRQVGNLQGEAACINCQGDIALLRENHDAAGILYNKALSLYHQVGSLLGEANCIRSLGDIAFQRADHSGAIARYDEALRLYGRVGNRLGEGNCHFVIARMFMAQGQRSEAAAKFSEALCCYEEYGNTYTIGAAHFLWAQACDGEQRDSHCQAAFQSWRNLSRQVLFGMAAMDGIQPAEIESLFDNAELIGSKDK